MQVARHWRLKAQRYNLIGATAPTTAVRVVPAEAPQTDAQVEEYNFTGRGEVYSYSTVYEAPAGFERYAPYVVALVKLAEGPLVTAQLADVSPDEVEIGMPVEMVTRKLRTEGSEGLIVYGYKFRPTLPV